MPTYLTPTVRFEDGSFTQTILSEGTAIPYTKLAQRTSMKIGVPLTSCRIHDAPQTLLGTTPTAGTSDDFGIAGVGSTSGMYLTTGDQKAQGSLTYYAWFESHLPPNYDDGETVQLQLVSGMLTTVAGASCTVDCEVWGITGTTGIAVDGLDLNTTAAQSCNSLTFANNKFDITSASLVAGQRLSVKIAMTINDAASGTAVIGAIREIAWLIDTKG